MKIFSLMSFIFSCKKIFFSIVIVCIFFFVFLSSPPSNFPTNTVLTISPGETLSAVATDLHTARAIRSTFLFRTAVTVFGGEKGVRAGDYLLDAPESSLVLAYRVSKGDFRLEPVKLTIPEGWSVAQIGTYIGERIIGFDIENFRLLAKSKEGFLFPDTYFVSPLADPHDIIDIMSNNFDIATAALREDSTSHPFADIVTLASLVEAEAATAEDRRIVAGILWKRLELGMPLQVDSSFLYINGKNTYELTRNDLQIDSPYNTYRYKGLPPTPINNPGLESLRATLEPVSSDYLYFLSSRDGKIYYAATLADHNKNKVSYGG